VVKSPLMKIIFFLSVNLILALLNYSCQRSTLTIVTVPEKATVSIIDPDSGLAKEIGKTPLLINEKTPLPAGVRDAQVWGITLSKKGHVLEHIFVDRAINSKISVSTTLKRNSDWFEEGGQAVGELAGKIGRSLKDVFRLIHARQYSEAMKIIENLTSDFPNTAIFYDIKGSLHLLKGERDAAISSYQKSLKINPDAPETRKALERLQGRSTI